MKRARPLALAGALMPVIGNPAPARNRRQRTGAALHWRKPAADRTYPVLNLTIRPAIRFRFDLGMLRSEMQHFAEAKWKPAPDKASIAGPRGAAGLRMVELLWHSVVHPNAAPMTGAMRKTPAEFVTLAQRKLSAQSLDPQPFAASRTLRPALAMAEWRARSAVRPEQRIGSSAPPSALVQWAPGTQPRRLGSARSAVIGAMVARRTGVALPTAAPRTPSQHEARVPVQKLPRAAQVFAAVSRREAATPAILTRSIAPPASRNAPSPHPPTRRSAIDLAWQPRADAPATTQDIVTLARSLGAPEISRSVSAAHAANTAQTPSIPAAFPNTSRIVDEVIAQIERRTRSDRLRRGL